MCRERGQFSAATAAYLNRLSGSREIVLGFIVPGRRRGTESVPSAMVNTLPLRIPVDPAGDARSLVRRTHEEIRDLVRHQGYRGVELARDLGKSANQLFGPVVNMRSYGTAVEFAGIRAQDPLLSPGPAEDVVLTVFDYQDDRGWGVELSADRCADTEIAAHGAEFVQTLTDLMTIRSLKGRLDHITIGLCGDLKFGRTVHSLVAAMSRYTGVRFVFVSPEELKLPRYVKEQYVKSKNIPYTQSTSLEEVMPELDILYMTRVQKERFFNEEDYLRLKDSYILTPEKLENAKEDLRILHPLPRVNEISVAVDEDPRACYFKQAQNGRYIRMALIMKLLGIQ